MFVRVGVRGQLSAVSSFPSSTWALGIKLRSSASVTSTFIYWAISLARVWEVWNVIVLPNIFIFNLISVVFVWDGVLLQSSGWLAALSLSPLSFSSVCWGSRCWNHAWLKPCYILNSGRWRFAHLRTFAFSFSLVEMENTHTQDII